MNHRIKLTALALAGTLLGAGVAAGAQSPPPDAAPGMHVHHGHRGIMARAMDGLSLTPAQKVQIRNARSKYKTSRSTSTPETREQLQADVEAALTPAQRTQYEANVTTLRAQMRAERKNGGTPSPVPSPQ